MPKKLNYNQKKALQHYNTLSSYDNPKNGNILSVKGLLLRIFFRLATYGWHANVLVFTKLCRNTHV